MDIEDSDFRAANRGYRISHVTLALFSFCFTLTYIVPPIGDYLKIYLNPYVGMLVGTIVAFGSFYLIYCTSTFPLHVMAAIIHIAKNTPELDDD